MNTCRICMDSDKKLTFSSMFNNNSENASRFFLLTGLVVTEIDGIETALICNFCSLQLKVFSLWRERCRNNDKMFRKLCVDVSVESPQSTIIKLDILPDVEFSIEEIKTTTDTKPFINGFQTETATSTKGSDEMCDGILPRKELALAPSISNESEKKNYLIQSRKCRICNETFKSKAKCSYHFKIHHPFDKQYECKCGMKFFEVSRNYHSHILAHQSGYNSSDCSHYNEEFNSTENYSSNVQTHESELDFKLPFTTEDKEKIFSSWNEDSLNKYSIIKSNCLNLQSTK